MNCEKCKNKKATVFYADDAGAKHSLCSPCAAILGKVSEYGSITDEDGDSDVPFLPSSHLFSLALDGDPVFPIYITTSEHLPPSSQKCPFCSTSLDIIEQRRLAGCPECFTVFGDLLFPSTLTPDRASGARIPSIRRATIDRQRNIASLKLKIKAAVESENYELAAQLRDSIRKLEAIRS